MKELKSAFDIEGFIEGTTIIERGKVKYKVHLGEIFWLSVAPANWSNTGIELSWFSDKEFKTVEEKKKYWRHVYISGMPCKDVHEPLEQIRYSVDNWDQFKSERNIQIESKQVEL